MKKLSRRQFLKVCSCAGVAAGTATVLSGCGASSSTASSAASSGAASSSSSANPYLASETPVTFKIFASLNNMAFDSTWPVFQKAAEATNVSLEGVIPQTNSDVTAAFNLMVSSGDLADIISYNTTAELEKLGHSGGLLALNDLIDQYAPHIKEALDKYTGLRGEMTALDGNIYEVRKANILYPAEYWWIRKDWLDKLGLAIPETVDDLHDVLTAFRTKDPNGNGQQDEVPLFDRAGYKMPDEYLWLWDSSTEFNAVDGKMVFEPMEENFKVAVPNIAQWYKEGLIDPEIFTRGPKSRDILFGGNLGGCTHDWVSASGYNDSLKTDVPGFNLVSMAPPKNQNGKIIERARRNASSAGWCISSTCPDPVAAIKYMDYFYTDEGSRLANFGIEGDSYTVNADGTIAYTDKIMKSESTPLGALRAMGVGFCIGMPQLPEYEYASMTQAGKDATKMYDEHREWYPTNQPPFADGRLNLRYPEEDETEYTRIMGDIRSYVDEKFQAWMMGTADFAKEYDGFVAELKSRGIDRAIEINQTAYEAYLAKL